MNDHFSGGFDNASFFLCDATARHTTVDNSYLSSLDQGEPMTIELVRPNTLFCVTEFLLVVALNAGEHTLRFRTITTHSYSTTLPLSRERNALFQKKLSQFFSRRSAVSSQRKNTIFTTQTDPNANALENHHFSRRHHVVDLSGIIASRSHITVRHYYWSIQNY